MPNESRNKLAYEKFVDMSIRAYTAEEARLDSVRSRAATLLGAASIVSGLMLFGLEWSTPRIAAYGWVWGWLSAFVLLGALPLLSSVGLAIHLLMPKTVWNPTEPRDFLQMTYLQDDLVVLRVLGEAYQRATLTTAPMVDKLLLQTQWAGWLLLLGVVTNVVLNLIAAVLEYWPKGA